MSGIELDRTEFDNRMKDLLANVQDIDTVLKEFAERAISSIKAAAPIQSGALRNSINYELVDGGINFFVGVEYAVFVEYGTRNRQANPFFEISIRQHLPELEQMIRKGLTK